MSAAVQATLERRIASALAEDAVSTASDIAALIEETDEAVAAADEATEAESARALDLTLLIHPK